MPLLDTNLLFAVRCANCGKITLHNVSIFKLLQQEKTELCCECSFTEASVTLKNNRCIHLDIPCLACEVKHTYKYSINNLLKRKVTVICCSDTELELCFLGKTEDVKYTVYKYQQGINELLNELGLYQSIEWYNKAYIKYIVYW